MSEGTISQELALTVLPVLSQAALVAATSLTIDQYKLFGLYSEEIDAFLDSIVSNVELVLAELKEGL